MDLYIEFDNRQLTFQTNVDEVHDYVQRSFRHMLVPGVESSAGMLTFMRTLEGYSLESAEKLEYADTQLESLLPLIKDEVRLQFMRGRPDLLWLHAGVIERAGGALLLSGPSGQGKSTLSTRLCEKGWRFLSDDIAPVRMDADRVLPFLQTPVRRLHPGREVAAEELSVLERESVQIDDEGVFRGEPAIRGIVFIRYASGSTAELARLRQGSAALELLRNATNFSDHRGAAVTRAAELATRLPIYSLVYDLPADAAKTLETLW